MFKRPTFQFSFLKKHSQKKHFENLNLLKNAETCFKHKIAAFMLKREC